ncbi:hypothetical protein Tco_1355073 [Tanacetum coccineum]
MADHSQKCHDGTSSKNISSRSNADGLATITRPHLDKECPLNEEVKQVEEVNYGGFGHPAPFNGSNGTKFRVGSPGYYTRTDNQTPSKEKKPNLVKTINKYMEEDTKRQSEQDEWLKTFCQNTENSRIDHDKDIQKLKSRVKTLTAEVETKVAKLEGCKIIFANDGTPLYIPFYYYPEKIEYFSSNSGFSNDEKSETTKVKTSKVILEWKSNLSEQTKIKINPPLLKEIRQTDNYPKYMKDLVANKQLTEDDDEVRMNPRCSVLLQNMLPPKKMIQEVLFFLALSEGIGKLEPINMVIEMADDTKCILKGIVKNLLIKIDKLILPINVVILDIIADFRMPVGNEKESENDSKRIDVEWENLCLNDWLRIRFGEVSETARDKILRGHWRKTFGNEYDDNEEFEDSDGCGENDDDLEGIIDYLELTLYVGFIDSDDEEYKERKCILLGMPYIKPPLILIEKVNITRYSIAPGEVYTKIKLSGVEELSRIRGNIATIRAGIMDEIFNDDKEESYDET